MNVFQYRDNQLFAEEVALSRIAQDCGTPCFVYSRAALEARFLAYQQSLEGQDHLICYAVKSNSNLAVLNVLAKLGAGFDIVSEGELERVLAAGGDPQKIIFSGVGKQAHEMARALDVGIHCFNVESVAELQRLSETASKKNMVANISLRVNPDVDAQTHPYISTGLKDNKFGVAIENALEIYQLAAKLPGIRVIGVDCHIGSQLTSLPPFLDALDRLLVLIDTLEEAGITISHLDLGGGLGVQYQDEQPPSPQEYIAAILARLGDRKFTLQFEPGRSISANAGVMLTKVEYLKETQSKNFAIIDGAMNDIIRPALYQAVMEVLPLSAEDNNAEQKIYDLVGPVCESADFIAKDRSLALNQGDVLAVCSAGAYCFVMSSNYNTRNRAPEIMVDGDQYQVVRRRETYADQLGMESILAD